MNTPSPESEVKPRSKLRPILKWTGIGLGTLIALVIIAIVVIPRFVNTGPIKHEIERIASRETGRSVTISGPLSLSLFPWVGFDAKDISMANKSGFGNAPFLKAKELDIHVRLIPLIFHRVEVSGITLDELSLALLRRANGASNWEDFTGKSTGPSTSKRSALAGLSVGSIVVRNSTLSYEDMAKHKRYVVTGFTLKSGEIQPARSFPLSFQFKLASQTPHFDSKITLDTRATIDEKTDTVSLSNGSLTADIANAGLGVSHLPVATNWQQISLNKRAGTARLADLTLKLAGVSARLDAAASGINTSPTVTGHLVVAPFAPRKLFEALGSPIPTKLHGFNSASLRTDIKVGANSIHLSNLALKIDETTLTGDASLVGKQRVLRFDLAADRLDLDRYFPPGSGPAAHAGTAHGTSFLEMRLPGRLLKPLILSGRFNIARLNGFGLSAQNAGLRMSAANGSVSLDPMTAKLYGGTFTGKISVAAAGQGIRLETNDKLSGVHGGDLLAALYGAKPLTGTADAAVQLSGQGNTVAELIDDLKGKTAFSLQHGAIDGFNLQQSIERAYALVKEHKVIPATGPNSTEFADIRGTATLKNGLLKNDSLTADLPFAAISGHGTINLRSSYVDYDLLGKVTKTPKTAGVNLLRLKGLTVPIHVSGYAKSLSSVPDMKQALAAAGERVLRKKLEAQKKAAESKLKKQLQDLLGGGGGG